MTLITANIADERHDKFEKKNNENNNNKSKATPPWPPSPVETFWDAELLHIAATSETYCNPSSARDLQFEIGGSGVFSTIFLGLFDG